MLGMLPLPIKLWSRARGGCCNSWSEGLEAHWDTALKGSSALRAGLLRACLDEVGAELGATAMTLLLDIDKFYDTVSFVILMRIALRLGFPAVGVALEVAAFIGPRFLQERNIASEAVWVTRSLVAGSARGVHLAKLFLHPVLDRAHRRAPEAALWTFVDDNRPLVNSETNMF